MVRLHSEIRVCFVYCFSAMLYLSFSTSISIILCYAMLFCLLRLNPTFILIYYGEYRALHTYRTTYNISWVKRGRWCPVARQNFKNMRKIYTNSNAIDCQKYSTKKPVQIKTCIIIWTNTSIFHFTWIFYFAWHFVVSGRKGVKDYYLKPNDQMFKYIMTKTSNNLMRWWYPLCPRQTRRVWFL